MSNTVSFNIDEQLEGAQRYFKKKQYSQAIIEYLNVIRLNPSLEIAYHQLGLCYAQLEEKEEVLEYLNAIIHAKTLSYESIYSYLGLYYLSVDEASLARKTFERLSVIAPDNCLAQIGRIHLDLLSLNWESLSSDVQFLKHLINLSWDKKQHTLINPYYTLPLDLPKDLQLDLMRDMSRLAERQSEGRLFSHHLTLKKRRHIGYLSSDLYRHPLGMLIRDLFQSHDREQFHIHVYHLSRQFDEVTETIKKSVETFTDVSGLLNHEVARKIHLDNIDILVDLSAFTGTAKPSILAQQPAPIQCHMLGYPASLGSGFVQYFITSKTMVPSSLRDYFDEKLVYLPHPYVTPPFPEVTTEIERAEYGLPKEAMVFSCFTRFYKLSQPLFETWMQLLKQIPDSVLWFKGGNLGLQQKIIEFGASYGVKKHQFVFFKGEDLTKRWPQQLADVWLDTQKMSCGLGSILALWSGTPVLNLYGETPQARVGATILEACPAAGSSVESLSAYQEKAMDWSKNPDSLMALKQSLVTHKASMPLFNPKAFIKHLEKAYNKMWEQKESGQFSDVEVDS